MTSPHRAPQPIIWTILYLPFGALSGFITVALTFLANQHGLSIAEGAWLNGANLISQWLKWIWAPAIDITLSPKRWYVLSTAASGLGVMAMAAMPMGPDSLPSLLAVIALASLVNSVVGMAIEAMLAEVTPPDEIGRVSGWFQVGNLGGAGLGGGLGLYLMTRIAPWLTGVIMGGLFMACCLALLALPDIRGHRPASGPSPVWAAMKGVVTDLGHLVRTRPGLLAALFCFLPVGTGAGQGVLTQENVAAHWHAGADDVALVQGLWTAGVTALGCLFGGWLAGRVHPRWAYGLAGITLAAVGGVMAFAPATVTTYVVFSLGYAWAVGICYACFTALVLDAMGKGSAATKYTIYASLSNFPIWWLGLLLGKVAGDHGPVTMLVVEAAISAGGVLVFALIAGLSRTTPPAVTATA